MSSALQELLKLPVEDRLGAIEALWESIDANGMEIELSGEMKRELDRRLDEYERDPSRVRPLRDVIREIRDSK